MRINQLEIKNVRGIENVVIEDIPNTIVIAGPNGCGKSCILDCIRLMKSLHGGYEPNEAEVLWNTIIGSRRRGLAYLLRNPGYEGRIVAEITFSQREIEWLTGGRGKGARTETAWRLAFPQTDLWQWRWRGIRTPEMLQKTGEVEQEAERLKARIGRRSQK